MPRFVIINVTTLALGTNAKGQRPKATEPQLVQRRRAHFVADAIALQETRLSCETMLLSLIHI
eukprot:14848343-Alexandrium_andersonii.AAC.1